MGVSPKQAALQLRAFKTALPTAVLRGLRKGLPIARRYALTRYMERKDNRGGTFDPPNPPPGPLGIRQGNLARTVRVGEMRFDGKKVRASLEAGSSDVRYARIHELGGIIPIFRRPGPFAPIEDLELGSQATIIIPARPYLAPAMRDAEPEIVLIVSKEILILARVTLAGVIRIR